MAKVTKAKPSALKLNLHFTVQFNAYMREGVGVSEAQRHHREHQPQLQTLKAHFTSKFNLYVRGV
jgi:hypothetical protein